MLPGKKRLSRRCGKLPYGRKSSEKVQNNDLEPVETSRKIFLEVASSLGSLAIVWLQEWGWVRGKLTSIAAIVVEEIDKAVESGRLARAKALRSVLNHQSVDGAFKLSEKPTILPPVALK